MASGRTGQERELGSTALAMLRGVTWRVLARDLWLLRQCRHGRTGSQFESGLLPTWAEKRRPVSLEPHPACHLHRRRRAPSSEAGFVLVAGLHWHGRTGATLTSLCLHLMAPGCICWTAVAVEWAWFGHCSGRECCAVGRRRGHSYCP